MLTTRGNGATHGSGGDGHGSTAGSTAGPTGLAKVQGAAVTDAKAITTSFWVVQP
jgi:hypothetical protein